MKTGEKTVIRNGLVTTSVNGGSTKREADSGRLVEVQSETGTYRVRSKTEIVVDEAASKRHSALKRLADR